MEVELILTHKCSLKCKQCYALHNNTVISEEILKKSIEYIHELIDENIDEDDDFEINLVGGEVGVLNHSWLLSLLDRLLDCKYRDRICIGCRSNLIFKMTDDFIQFAKRCNSFGTSYDYKTRFNTDEEEKLWKENIKILQDNGVDLDCIMTINKEMMNDLSAQDIFKFMEDLNIKRYDLHRLFYTENYKNKLEYDNIIRPLNRDVDRWLFEVFLEYEKYKETHPEVSIETFESIKDGLNGEYTYTHYRNCQKECRTINPNGTVSQCTYTQNRPFYNLITKEENKELFDSIVKHEEERHEDCKNCDLLKYCNGDCCWFPHDESGCPGLKMIYEYLIMQGYGFN